MALDALDRLETVVASLDGALVDLEASPSYLMVTHAEAGSETFKRFGRAASELTDCWAMLDLARQALTRLGAELGPVTKRSDPGRVEKAVNRVDLSFTHQGSPSTPSPYSASSLVAEVRRRVDAAQVGVDAIDDRWHQVLPRVTAARETVERLRSELEPLGVTEPLVSMTARRADELAERLMEDPMAVEQAEGAELDVLASDAARQVASLRVGHENLDADLAQTEEVLATLRVLRARAEGAHAEAMAKVTRASGLMAVPAAAVIDGPGGLGQQLDDLFTAGPTADEAAAGGSRWMAQRAKLDRWLALAARLQAQLEKAEAANRSPIESRDSLRGRLTAYMAKMSAIGRAEDLGLAELTDRAHDLLYTAPTDLDAATEALADLAEAMRK